MTTAKKRNIFTFIGPAGFLLLLYLGYFFIKDYFTNNWSQQKIKDTYYPSMVMVLHSYVFKLEIDDGGETVYFIKKSDGSFQQWQKNDAPIITWGCGLIRGADMSCVTTDNMSSPWEQDLGNKAENKPRNPGLEQEITIYRRVTKRYASASVSGFTVQLGYYAQTKKEEQPQWYSCNYEGSYENYKLAILKTTVAGNNRPGLRSFQKINVRPSLKPGSPVFMLDFSNLPANHEAPYRQEPVLIKGVLMASEAHDLYNGYFHYNIPVAYFHEGALLVNSKGELIGFQTSTNAITAAILTHFSPQQ